MTIRHLKIFIKVVETGKMSTAAEQLYITQPSVSQAIHELEAHYQTLLFERLSKKLFITNDGKLFYHYAKQVISQFDLMEENMLNKNRKETLRIGATVSVCGSILSGIIKDLQDKSPDTDLYAYGSNTQIIEEKLLKMELDVGIIEGQVKHRDLIQIPIIDDMLVLVCNMNHPFAKLDVISVSDLQDQNFVMREVGSGTRELFEKTLDAYNVRIKTLFEENTPGAILNAVLINNCLCVISARLVEKEAMSNQVKLFVRENHGWDRSFSLVYHKDKFFTNSMEILQKILWDYKCSHMIANVKTGILTD